MRAKIGVPLRGERDQFGWIGQAGLSSGWFACSSPMSAIPSGVCSARVAALLPPMGIIVADTWQGAVDCAGCLGSGTGGSLGMISLSGTGSV